MLLLPVGRGSVFLVSITLAWATQARAQVDDAPPPAPPAEPAPPPAAPAPPTDAAPPAAPPESPPPPSSPPPAAPPPPAPPSTAPPSADFPLPPASPPAAKPPAAKPPAQAVEPPPAAKPVEPAFVEKPTEPNKPAPATKPAGTPPPEPVRHHEDEEESVDQFKIGPVAGIGIPSIISFGGTLKLTRFLGAGVNIGLIPKVQMDYYGKATLSYQHYDIYGRLYPFGGGFFLGAGAGYATVDGTLAASYSSAATVYNGVSIPGGSATYSGTGTVRTLMLTALIGYFYTTSIGFSIGVDAGAQIPIAPSEVSFSSGLKTNPEQAAALFTDKKKEADDSVRSTLEKIGRTPLPTLNLRIGWIL